MLSLLRKLIKNNDILFALLKRMLLYARYLKSLFEKDKYCKIPKVNPKSSFDISKKGHHCFFGYYDKSPVDITGNYIIYLRVKNGCRPGEDIEVCIYDINKKESKVLSKTNAWNWQQGCMLHWIDKNHISFNVYDTTKEQYKTAVLNIHTKEISYFNRASYTYNSEYTAFLSLNFYRLYKFAKGYGYPFYCDSMNVSNDGIWETSLATKETKLILSLDRIIKHNPHYGENWQHYINHITYCPDKNNIIFIHRWQKPGTNFMSRLLMYNRLIDKLETILDSGHVSHYCWKSATELMIYATNKEEKTGYMIVDLISKKTRIIKGLPTEDGHPSYSNDRKQILTDTYPNNHRIQHLFIYNVENQQLQLLDKLRSPFKYLNDERCDLHPKWSFDNKYILVDNTNSGYRTLKCYIIK
jgi:hypothetical protein